MKITVTLSDFRQAFKSHGRGTQFSYEGLIALFEYLEECERDLGEEHELDVVALCCDFSEDSASGIAEEFGLDVDGLDSEEVARVVADYLLDEGIWVANFEDDTGLELFIYRNA
jgi:hypothetical protein